MTDAKTYAMVFAAAAEGAMKPFQAPSGMPSGSMWPVPPGRDNALVIAGAFRAIADVFQKIADAESAPPA